VSDELQSIIQHKFVTEGSPGILEHPVRGRVFYAEKKHKYVDSSVAYKTPNKYGSTDEKSSFNINVSQVVYSLRQSDFNVRVPFFNYVSC